MKCLSALLKTVKVSKAEGKSKRLSLPGRAQRYTVKCCGILDAILAQEKHEGKI